MKDLCGIILLFLGFTSYGQIKATDSLRTALVPVDVDSSAIGKPIGDAVTKTIGPEGGTISSADGLMELSFPPGALAAPTNIGIQSIENTSVMNFGKTYACSPDGLHFQKPVGLVIHYVDSMTKEITASIPAIRWQDKSGRWSSVEKISQDSVAHTLSGAIEHFSNYSAATTFKVTPINGKVKVGNSRLFMLIITGKYPDGKKYRSGVDANHNFWKDKTVEWSVNGVPGGNDRVGRIQPFAEDQQNGAMYTAPAVLPGDAVIIMAKYIGTVPLGQGTYAENVVSKAVADIYDEFRFSFTGYDIMGHLQMIDSSSCDIRAYSSGKLELYNIQNYPPWSDWPARIGTCSYEYPDKTSWKGLVQISGMSSGVFQRLPAIPPAPAPYPKIVISLIPTIGSSPPYIAHCKGGATRTVGSYPITASPSSIKLELMPVAGIYVWYGGSGGLNTYKYISRGQGFFVSASRIP